MNWKPTIRMTVRRGNEFHQADWFEAGKRHRKTFRQREDLDAFIKTKRDELRAVDELRRVEGKSHAVVRLSHLAPDERSALADALAIITKAGGTCRHMVEAARNYVRSHLAFAGAKTVAEVLEDFLLAKERARKRDRTLEGYRLLLTPFAEHFKGRAIHTLTLPEIEAYARKAAPGASTWNHLRVAVIGLLNHATVRGWADHNPAAKLDRVAEDRGLPSVFTPADVRNLLDAAADIEPRMIPYYVIGTFSGLRPTNELRNLTWRNINLAEGFIRVEAATSKTRRLRNVPLAENATAWLRQYAEREGQLFYSRHHHEKIVKAAKLKWGKDTMRHSYGSYLLAHTENEAAVASRMGNSVNIVHAHYKNLRSKKEAAQFWGIAPTGEAVLRFRATA